MNINCQQCHKTFEHFRRSKRGVEKRICGDCYRENQLQCARKWRAKRKSLDNNRLVKYTSTMKNKHAIILGKIGGKSRSPKKVNASRQNMAKAREKRWPENKKEFS